MSYILLTVMSLSLLTGCSNTTRTTRTRRVVAPNDIVTKRGNVVDTDGIIDGDDGEGRTFRGRTRRHAIYDGDGDGHTVYDSDGRVITRSDGRITTRGSTRRAIDDINR